MQIIEKKYQFDYENESVDKEIEVLSSLSYYELLIMLNEFLNNNHNASSKLKPLRKPHVILTKK